MKKCLLLAFFTILSYDTVWGQVSPYSLSPDWAFGSGGRLRFPNGNFPMSGAPTPAFRNTNISAPPDVIGAFTGEGAVEASTSLCHNDGSVAIYSNTSRIWNGSATVLNDHIRNFITDNTCAGSSTGGAVSFPDPTNPTGAFYVVLANDLTSGTCPNKGVHRYRFTGSGNSVAWDGSLPVTIAPDAFACEALAVGTDGTGGYWLVAHDQGTANIFRIWHYTSTGISAPVDYNMNDFFTNVNFHSYLKFSPCQNQLAFAGGNAATVYSFNRTSGAIIAETRRVPNIGHGTGVEFSPDGNRLFYTGQGTVVNYVDILTGATGNVSGSASWSLQMGPDGKIYTSPGGNSNVGIISTPNVTPTYGVTALPGGATIYRGLVNIAWLTPKVPVITPAATATCNIYNFSYAFENYFGTNIGITPGSEVWNFDDGSGDLSGLGATPSHTFPSGSGGPYDVTLTFKDATCGQDWTATIPVTVTCSAPVELISFNGVASAGGADLIWKTAMELNNDYFDLQRSTDGVHFSSIAEIKGAGTTKLALTYNYRDTEVSSGVVYYRLAQHDYDGTISYSKIIAVHFDKAGSTPVLVAPNPFSSSFVLSKIFSEAATVSVYDVYGRLLEQKETSAEEFSVTLGEGLANGSYIVQYLTGANNYTLHVEKK